MDPNYIDISEVQNTNVFESFKEVVVCNICQGILVDPRQCSTCTYCYCLQCITNWMNSNDVCPDGCIKFEMEKAPRAVTVLLAKLILKKDIKYKAYVAMIQKKQQTHCETQRFSQSKFRIEVQQEQISPNNSKKQSPLKSQPKSNVQNDYCSQSQFLRPAMQNKELINTLAHSQSQPANNNTIMKNVLTHVHKNRRIQKKMKYHDGNEYEGEWLDNNKDGYGVYKWVSGQVYEGYFKNDKHHGKGKMTYSDGNTYDGEWINGKREGYCVFNWLNGPRYEGMFTNDILQGKGKMFYENGETYEGEWVDGVMEGYGKYTWPSGQTYEGYYVKGVENGKGKMIYPTGEIYDGEFLNGNFEGYGDYFWADDTVFKGNWSNNLKNGFGKLISPNGEVEYGTWVDDVKK